MTLADPTKPGQSDVICPECGEPMRRDRRVLVNGRTPFRCENGHLVVHDKHVYPCARCGWDYACGDPPGEDCHS